VPPTTISPIGVGSIKAPNVKVDITLPSKSGTGLRKKIGVNPFS
jgi:hypothetical protein